MVKKHGCQEAGLVFPINVFCFFFVFCFFESFISHLFRIKVLKSKRIAFGNKEDTKSRKSETRFD